MKMKSNKRANWFSPFSKIVVLIILLYCGAIHSQDDTDDGTKSADEIAKELSNPIGTLANFT